MTANVCKGYDGDMVLEIWEGKRKMTIYVDKRNAVTDCLTVDEQGVVDETGLFDALRFIHDKPQENK